QHRRSAQQVPGRVRLHAHRRRRRGRHGPPWEDRWHPGRPFGTTHLTTAAMPAKKTSRRGRPSRVTSAQTAAGTTKLEAVRARIDGVDEQIQRLINERAKLAQLVGISKSRDGHTVDFYRPEREAQVLRRARERNRGPLRDEEVVRLFREIMSACLAQQEPLKVAYLGPEATFSQTAVLTH